MTVIKLIKIRLKKNGRCATILSMHYKIANKQFLPFITALVVLFKILTIFGIGAASTLIFSPSRVHDFGFLAAWNIWDAPHYLDIAAKGYQTTGDMANFIVFFPVFPIFISFIHLILFVPILLSSYIVTLLAAIGAGCFLYKLVLLDEDRPTAFYSVLLLFLFPTAFFLHIPYTESLMVFFVTASFYFVRQKKYLISFIFAMLASTTRLTGLAIIPALVFELYFYHRDIFKHKLPLPWLLVFIVPPLGFAAYLFLNLYLFGDMTHFLQVQKINWGTEISFSLKGLTEALNNITWRKPDEALYIGYAQIGAFLLGTAGLIYSSIKLRISYAVYYFFGFLVIILPSFWLSLPRYELVLFPLFIMLAKLSKNKLFLTLWLAFSLVFYLMFSLIAVQHGPVF